MKGPTFDLIPEFLYQPLRSVLKKAKDDNVENFDLEELVHDAAKDNHVTVAKLTRFHIYEASADLIFANNVTRPDDGSPATPKQRDALRRFRVDPDMYPTKAEASDMLDILIRRVKKSK